MNKQMNGAEGNMEMRLREERYYSDITTSLYLKSGSKSSEPSQKHSSLYGKSAVVK